MIKKSLLIFLFALIVQSAPVFAAGSASIKATAKRLSADSRDVLNIISDAIKPEQQIEDEETITLLRGTDKKSPLKEFPTAKPDVDGKVRVTKNGLELELSEPPADKLAKANEKLNPKQVEEIVTEGYRAKDMGQLESAMGLFKKALKSDMSNVDALFGLGTVYHSLGQLEEARVLYSEALSIRPGDEEILNNFLAIAAIEAPDEAIAELKKLEEINPKFGLFSMHIGLIYADKKEYKKAIKYTNKAILMDPENITFKYNAAVILDKMKDYKQAIVYYKEVLEEGIKQKLPINRQELDDRMRYIAMKVVS